MSVWMQFWSERTLREKALIAVGAFLLAFAILYGILWAPARNHREQLTAALPTLQHDTAQMRAQAATAHSLGAAAAVPAPTGSALQDAVKESLQKQGIANAQVDPTGNGVRVQVKNAAFSAWVAWLDSARRQLKVQVAEAHVKALPTDGQVDLDAVLEPPSRPATQESR